MEPTKNHGPSKKTFAVGLLTILFILFALIKGIPVISSFLISFKSYTPSGGIAGSPWVGLSNYQKLFSSFSFSILVRNSLLLNGIGMILQAAAGFGLAQLVLHVDDSRLQRVSTGLLLLPAFIPNLAYLNVFLSVFGINTQDKALSLFILQFLLIDILKNGFFTAFIGAACGRTAIQRGKRPTWGALAGVGVCILFRFCSLYTPDAELAQLMANPVNQEISDVFDTYQYRTGLLSSQYSFSGAVWITKNLLQIIPALIAAVILVLMLKRYFRYLEQHSLPSLSKESSRSNMTGFAAIALSFAVPICITVGTLFINSSSQMNPPSAGGSSAPIINFSLLITLLATAAFGVVTLLLAFSLSKLFNGVMIVVFLFLSTILNNTVGEFMFYYKAGMLNTILPIILGNMFQISFIFLLAFLANQKAANMETLSFRDYLRLILPWLIVFMGLFAANIWGSDQLQHVYLRQVSVYLAAIAGGSQTVWRFVILIPSLILGGICITGYILTDRKSSEQ